MTELRIWGYRARLVIDLEGEEHDISHLLRIDSSAVHSGWELKASEVIGEIEVEKRARARGRTG